MSVLFSDEGVRQSTKAGLLVGPGGVLGVGAKQGGAVFAARARARAHSHHPRGVAVIRLPRHAVRLQERKVRLLREARVGDRIVKVAV